MAEMEELLSRQLLSWEGFYQGRHPLSWCYLELGTAINTLDGRDNERLLKFLNSSNAGPADS
ncbi:hypothetical protein [Nitrosococcus oceani]|uniref:hypothetical protein n=1 Tax=Nitrosococcus oceani TaxID=1229 RepID=UPI00030B5FD5|nr:hypothetical protein [Nitrosococcus oceani]